MLDNNFFVYAHKRPDTGEVFYVGRGKSYRRCSPTYRAYDKRRRTDWWKRIVAKNEGVFDVEILEWCNSREEVLHRETEYIKHYGRRMNGQGTLINFTAGGDGSLGLKHSDETKRKLSAARKQEKWRVEFLRSEEFKANRMAKIAHLPPPMQGKHHSAKSRRKMSEQRSGAKNINAKKVIDTQTKAMYGCVKDAANSVGIAVSSLYKFLGGKRHNPTSLRYL